MELKMDIKNVRCIRNLQFGFPPDSGIWHAITGEMDAVKYTPACASTVFLIPNAHVWMIPDGRTMHDQVSIGEAARVMELQK